MRNLNLLFHKEYYQAIGTKAFNDDVVKHNKDILSAVFTEKDYIPSKIANQTFILATQYPGLLIGVGNPHGAGKLGAKAKDGSVKDDKAKDDKAKDDSNEDVNLGFSFDYVTGQPYIPGSSVKGLLRSFFKYYPDRVNPVEEILRGMGFDNIEKDDVAALEKAVFDNADTLLVNPVEEKLRGKGFDDIEKDDAAALEKAVFNNADTFLDAVVYDGNEYGQLMGFDFITPHMSPVASPNPIRIIKVLPDVRFEFRFVLSDKKIKDKLLKADALKELFKKLLILFGAGAKTNVGYGVLTDSPDTAHRAIKRLPVSTQAPATKSADNTRRQKSNVNRINCPHCGASNFATFKDGTKRTKCYMCHKPLSS